MSPASLILERALRALSSLSLVGGSFAHERAYRLALKGGLRGGVERRRTVFVDPPTFFTLSFFSFTFRQSLAIHDSLAARFLLRRCRLGAKTGTGEREDRDESVRHREESRES